MKNELTISVVFTDLVGSTALASRLGPAQTEEVRVEHFSILRRALEAHGGTEVKNLGDGLMVVFASLGAALDGAVAMQQGIDRHNRAGGEELQIRVGVSTGDATAEDGDYFGEPVVEAARLEAKCRPGQILTTEMVRILQKRSDHDFRSVGELDLKGIPEPMEAFEVNWAPADAVEIESSIPMPGRLAGEDAVAFCGRQAELDALTQMWKSAKNGERRVALLAGEPGIGKTRLSAEVARLAHDDGATVLYGRCNEDVSVPYQPFVEALGHLANHADDELLQAHVEASGGAIATLVPSLHRRIPSIPDPKDTDPETERYLLFNAAAELLGAASEVAPVVVLLDDLHWADKQTILLLCHLVQSSTPMALLVLATYRDTDLSAGDAMIDTLADLRREPSVERLSLEGLDDRDVVAFLSSMAGHDLDEDAVSLAHLVRQETAGNPFFIGEMMRHLAESEQIVVNEAGRWVIAEGVDADTIGFPESVKETVGRRLGRLREEATRALSAAAVIGREFELETLEAVVDASEDELLDILEEAERAALVSEVHEVADRFRFMSGLIQQTIADDLSGTRRSRMHHRIAEALEAQLGADPGERVGELAHHWTAAMRPSEIEKAIEYNKLAGDRALEQLAPDEAVRWYRAALELRGDDGPDVADEQHADLLIGLGKAQRHAGIAEFRETLLRASRAAIEVADTGRLVEAVLANNRGMFSAAGQVDRERVAMLDEALAHIGPDDSVERARLLSILQIESVYAGDYPGRVAMGDEAVAIARRLDAPAALAQALTMRAESMRLPETLDARAADMSEARALADSLGDPYLRYWTYSFSANPALERGDMGLVNEFHTTAWTIAESIGQPVFAWHSNYHKSYVALVGGDADESERLATLALDKGTEAGEPDAFAIYGAQLLTIRWMQGRIGELVDLLTQAAADNPGLPTYKAALVISHLEAGNLDEARTIFEPFAAADFTQHERDNLWLAGIGLHALAAFDLGHQEAAATLVGLLEPAVGQVISTGASVFAPVDIALGRLAVLQGDPERALVHLERGERVAKSLQSPVFAAWARLETARALRARGADGDAARATALQLDCITLAEKHGAGYVLGLAKKL